MALTWKVLWTNRFHQDSVIWRELCLLSHTSVFYKLPWNLAQTEELLIQQGKCLSLAPEKEAAEAVVTAGLDWWEEFCWNSAGSVGRQANTMLVNQHCALTAKRANSILGCVTRRIDKDGVKPSSPFTHHRLDCFYSIAFHFGFPSTGKTSINYTGSSRGPPRWAGTGALTLWEETEKTGLIQPVAEMALGVPIRSSPLPLGSSVRR